MQVNVLQARDLTIRYGRYSAVDRISFDVQQGDLLGIVGPNGAGKTTLFRAMLGLQQYQGSMFLFGHKPDMFRSLIPMIGYVPQKIAFEPNFPATVSDIVQMGITPEKKLAKGARLVRQCRCEWNRTYGRYDKNEDKVNAVLDAVGVVHLRDHRIGELSGGEQQRVFIAKALVKDPVLMILDEPVTSVDAESQSKFYKIIQKLNRHNGITIIWSSHDLDAIETYAGKVACMNRRLFFHGTKDQFFSDENALKTYTESAMQRHMHNHSCQDVCHDT